MYVDQRQLMIENRKIIRLPLMHIVKFGCSRTGRARYRLLYGRGLFWGRERVMERVLYRRKGQRYTGIDRPVGERPRGEGRSDFPEI